MSTTSSLTSRARTALGLAVGTAVLGGLAACGATSGADESAIGSTEEWCEVAQEVDALVGDRTTRNTIHTELQEVYADARGPVVRLLDGLEHVDADHRDDVRALGEAMLEVSDALVDAPDQTAAEAALSELFEELDPSTEGGRAWVDATCGSA